MSQESNTKASRNGRAIEELVKRMLPDAEFVYNQFDAIHQGAPLEIKSCQTVVGDSSHGARTRSGRFAFNSAQHQTLLNEGGAYFFVVHDDGCPVMSFHVLAEDLDLPDFEGVKGVSWRTIARQCMEAM